jgi:hypothetical protein
LPPETLKEVAKPKKVEHQNKIFNGYFELDSGNVFPPERIKKALRPNQTLGLAKIKQSAQKRQLYKLDDRSEKEEERKRQLLNPIETKKYIIEN